jgi:cytochrome d ubiquinol oxidase subunit I
VVIGILSDAEKHPGSEREKDFHFKIEIPKLLSYMSFGSWDAYMPGIFDHLEGNPEKNIISTAEKIERGKYARDILRELKNAKESGDNETYESLKAKFGNEDFKNNYFRYFGYSYIDDPGQVVPNVPLTFYSFHLMVGLGFYFLLFFVLAFILVYRNTVEKRKWFQRLALITIPLAYLATMLGWTVAEVGRQPWVIQDLMPTFSAVSRLDSATVQVTFFLFLIIFTALLIAEVKIMTKQVKIGPKEGGQ